MLEGVFRFGRTEAYYDKPMIKNLLKLLSLPQETFIFCFVKLLVKSIMEKRWEWSEGYYDKSSVHSSLLLF
jgi:hypothetical protein